MSVTKLPSGKYQARYRDRAGKQHARNFEKKRDAVAWEEAEKAALITDRYVTPKTRRTTVGEWCDTWLLTYKKRVRHSTWVQARTHVRRIQNAFADYPLGDLQPIDIEGWMGDLKEQGLEISYRQALHRRLSTIYSSAIRNKLVVHSPVSRETGAVSDGGKRPVYICTDEQLWALHDALPEGLRTVVLLGAYAGLRVAEIAALRPQDVDFLRRVIRPAVQWPADPLKTDASRKPIPVPQELLAELAAAIERWQASTIVVGTFGRPVTPYRIEEAWRKARATVEGLPDGYRIHDLRHFFASMLIGSGLDIVRVSEAMRHSSPSVTMNLYAHLMPGRDDETRNAIAAAMTMRRTSVAARPAPMAAGAELTPIPIARP